MIIHRLSASVPALPWSCPLLTPVQVQRFAGLRYRWLTDGNVAV